MREDGGKEYLVKYKELLYEKCYGNFESDISIFHHEIERFKDINSDTLEDKYVEHKRNHKNFKMFDDLFGRIYLFYVYYTNVVLYGNTKILDVI